MKERMLRDLDSDDEGDNEPMIKSLPKPEHPYDRLDLPGLLDELRIQERQIKIYAASLRCAQLDLRTAKSRVKHLRSIIAARR